MCMHRNMSDSELRISYLHTLEAYEVKFERSFCLKLH